MICQMPSLEYMCVFFLITKSILQFLRVSSLVYQRLNRRRQSESVAACNQKTFLKQLLLLNSDVTDYFIKEVRPLPKKFLTPENRLSFAARK